MVNKKQRSIMMVGLIAVLGILIFSGIIKIPFLQQSIYTSGNLDFLKQKCADPNLGGMGVIYMNHPSLSAYCLRTVLNNPLTNVCEEQGYTNPVTCGKIASSSTGTTTTKSCSDSDGGIDYSEF